MANEELHATYDRLLTLFERTRQQVGELQQRLSAVTGTATAPDGAVTATVGPRGELTALELTDRALHDYRADELAELILETARAANRRVQRVAAPLYGPFLPAGVTYEQMLTGTVDASAVLPDEPLTPANFDRWWSRFGLAATTAPARDAE